MTAMTLYPKKTFILFPPRIPIHPLRFLPHPLHPPLHQLLILLRQRLGFLLRHVQLQPQRHHLVLRVFHQRPLAAQLFVPIAELPLAFEFRPRQLCDLRRVALCFGAGCAELRGQIFRLRCENRARFLRVGEIVAEGREIIAGIWSWSRSWG